MEFRLCALVDSSAFSLCLLFSLAAKIYANGLAQALRVGCFGSAVYTGVYIVRTVL